MFTYTLTHNGVDSTTEADVNLDKDSQIEADKLCSFISRDKPVVGMTVVFPCYSYSTSKLKVNRRNPYNKISLDTGIYDWLPLVMPNHS